MIKKENKRVLITETPNQKDIREYYSLMVDGKAKKPSRFYWNICKEYYLNNKIAIDTFIEMRKHGVSRKGTFKEGIKANIEKAEGKKKPSISLEMEKESFNRVLNWMDENSFEISKLIAFFLMDLTSDDPTIATKSILDAFNKSELPF